MQSDLHNREIVITREFNYPRELVFRAWNDPRHLARWWGPQGFASTVEVMDVRPGGSFRLTMIGPGGMTCPCEGTYREIVPPERIVFAGPAENVHPCGAGLPPRSLITVTFVERGNNTLLTIHTRFEAESDRDAAIQSGYNPGWESCLVRFNDELSVPSE